MNIIQTHLHLQGIQTKLRAMLRNARHLAYETRLLGNKSYRDSDQAGHDAWAYPQDEDGKYHNMVTRV